MDAFCIYRKQFVPIEPQFLKSSTIICRVFNPRNSLPKLSRSLVTRSNDRWRGSISDISISLMMYNFILCVPDITTVYFRPLDLNCRLWMYYFQSPNFSYVHTFLISTGQARDRIPCIFLTKSIASCIVRYCTVVCDTSTILNYCRSYFTYTCQFRLYIIIIIWY